MLFNGASSISVPADFEIANKKLGFTRSFVFLKAYGKIANAKIVEIIGEDPLFIEKNKDRIIKDYNKNMIDGFSGAILTYDIYYRPLRNRTYKNGKVVNTTASSIVKASGPSLDKDMNTAQSSGCETQSAGLTPKAKPMLASLGSLISDLLPSFNSFHTASSTQCYSVYWVTVNSGGGENWQYLYSYCDDCGGGAGGGGSSDSPVPISSFEGFPPNPYNGQVNVYINALGERTEFTYNSSLGLWLLPEVQVFADMGYTLALDNAPSFDENYILAAIALPVAATFSSPLLAVGAAVILTTVFVYKLSEWAANKQAFDEELHLYCLSYYVPCADGSPETGNDCSTCLHFCEQQGYWNASMCPSITPVSQSY